MIMDNPTKAVDMRSLLAALEPCGAAQSSAAPAQSPASALHRSLKQTPTDLDNATEDADITSLLALIGTPPEDSQISTAPARAPAPGAMLRRRLRQTKR